MNKPIKNEIVFALDSSSSMSNLRNAVIKVVNNQIEYLARRSKELNQETRVSIYSFNDNVSCLVWDQDCLRLPSISDIYKIGGMTALIDGVNRALDDISEIPEKNSPISVLLYCLTDGLCNVNTNLAPALNKRLKSLPENYTVACFVPNQISKREAQNFGFSPDLISIWDTTEKGMEEVGTKTTKATESFFQARSVGQRSVKNLFQMDATVLDKKVVQNLLEPLKPSEYEVLIVRKDAVIKPFVESWLKSYTIGSSFYELTKPEKIQHNKMVCVKDKRNGKVYGGHNARKLLGLPDHEVKVSTVSHPDFRIFVQSGSVNRILKSGTELLVMK